METGEKMVYCENQEESKKTLERLSDYIRNATKGLQLRLAEVEEAKNNIKELQAVFDRHCYRAVHNLQQVLKNKLKDVRQDSTAQFKSRLDELDAASRAINKKITELIKFECSMKVLQDDVNSKNSEIEHIMKGDELAALFDGIPSIRMQPELPCQQVLDVLDTLQVKFDTGVPKLLPSQIQLPPPQLEEGCERVIYVSSRINRQGTFWAVVAPEEKTLSVLNDISLYIRDNYLHNMSWRTCLECGQRPGKGNFVYAQFPVDRKWYRARVEEVDPQITVLYLDYGNSHTVKMEQIIPCEEDIFKSCAYQAFECTLFDTLQDNLHISPRFAFNEMVMAMEVQARFISKVSRDADTLWYLDLGVLNKQGQIVSVKAAVDKAASDEGSYSKPAISCRDIRLTENPAIQRHEVIERPQEVVALLDQFAAREPAKTEAHTAQAAELATTAAKTDMLQHVSRPQETQNVLTVSNALAQTQNVPIASSASEQAQNVPIVSSDSEQAQNVPIVSSDSEQAQNVPIASSASEQAQNVPIASSASEQAQNVPIASSASEQAQNVPIVSSTSEQAQNVPMVSSSSEEPTEFPQSPNPQNILMSVITQKLVSGMVSQDQVQTTEEEEKDLSHTSGLSDSADVFVLAPESQDSSQSYDHKAGDDATGSESATDRDISPDTMSSEVDTHSCDAAAESDFDNDEVDEPDCVPRKIVKVHSDDVGDDVGDEDGDDEIDVPDGAYRHVFTRYPGNVTHTAMSDESLLSTARTVSDISSFPTLVKAESLDEAAETVVRAVTGLILSAASDTQEYATSSRSVQDKGQGESTAVCYLPQLSADKLAEENQVPEQQTQVSAQLEVQETQQQMQVSAQLEVHKTKQQTQVSAQLEAQETQQQTIVSARMEAQETRAQTEAAELSDGQVRTHENQPSSHRLPASPAREIRSFVGFDNPNRPLVPAGVAAQVVLPGDTAHNGPASQLRGEPDGEHNTNYKSPNIPREGTGSRLVVELLSGDTLSDLSAESQGEGQGDGRAHKKKKKSKKSREKIYTEEPETAVESTPVEAPKNHSQDITKSAPKTGVRIWSEKYVKVRIIDQIDTNGVFAAQAKLSSEMSEKYTTLDNFLQKYRTYYIETWHKDSNADLVVVKSPDDNSWKRAKVHATTANNRRVTVRYIDDGKIGNVKDLDSVRIPEGKILAAISTDAYDPQAIWCVLDGWEHVNVSENFQEIKDKFKILTTGKPLTVYLLGEEKEPRPARLLVEGGEDNVIDINKEIVSLGGGGLVNLLPDISQITEKISAYFPPSPIQSPKKEEIDPEPSQLSQAAVPQCPIPESRPSEARFPGSSSTHTRVSQDFRNPVHHRNERQGSVRDGRRGQREASCFICHDFGHVKANCPQRPEPPGKDQLLCFHCGDTGHYKIDCPQNPAPNRCFYCHQLGHIQTNCPQKSEQSRRPEGGRNRRHFPSQGGHRDRPSRGRDFSHQADSDQSQATLRTPDEDWNL